MTSGRSRLAAEAMVLGPLLVAWTVVFASLPPGTQDFPLNDDVAYSAGLFDLLNGAGVHYFGWASAVQLGQWLWAMPFVLVLGQSFVATRLATIVLSAIGALALWDVLEREEGVSDVAALAGTATYSLNPLLFMMSGTYMTDVPALSFSLIALSAMSRCLRGTGPRARAGYAILCGASATLAVMTRQNALVVPCVMSLMMYRERTLVVKQRWLALTAAVPLIAGLATALWFLRRPDGVAVIPELPSFDHLLRVHASIVMYLGLFIAPLLLLIPWRSQRPRSMLLAFGTALGCAAAWVLYLRRVHGRTLLEGGLFPYIGNVLTAYGSFGTDLVLGRRPVVIGEGLRVALTLLGCAGAAWLISQALRAARRPAAISPLMAFGALHLPFLYASAILFDRYLLPLLPAAISVALWRVSGHTVRFVRWRAVATTMLLAVSGLCATALTHDWLAWNAARWTLGRRSISAVRPAAAIEGGYEWDEWFALKEGRWRGIEGNTAPVSGLAIPFNANLVSGLTGDCGLSFSEMPGTTVKARAPYRSWLAGGAHDFLLVCLDVQQSPGT